MPTHQNTNENNKKTKTITELYHEQRLLKEEMQQIVLQKKATRYKELLDSTQPEWKAVSDEIDKMKYTVHRAYEASWSRLLDLYVRLHEAWLKTGPIMTNRLIDKYLAPISFKTASAAAGAAGGLAGGLVGAVGTLFNVGDGVSATARKASKFVLGQEDNDIQYSVDLNKDGEVQYWLKRSDGKKLTQEEKDGYIAEVDSWLHGLGYVPQTQPGMFEPAPKLKRPPLNTVNFETLRDDREHGLAQHFSKIKAKLQLEPQFEHVTEERQDTIGKSMIM